MTTFLRTTALSALLAASALTLPAQAPGCQRRSDCADVSSFTATVTDFRTSQQDRGTRILTATVRFLNKTTRPLIIGYVQNSGVGTDDQGNRFVVYGAQAVRGMGEIASSTFDPKFVLQPGEASDARFEFTFRMPSANTILGTKYDMELAVREINPVAGNQFRLGREHALQFRGFGNDGYLASAGTTTNAPVVQASAASPAAAVTPATDPCEGRTRCYATGPFMAEVDRFTQGIEGNRHHVLRVNVKVTNTSPEPLILAYKATTSGATDNLGNRYYFGRPGTYDMSATGIGKVEGRNADPQFALAPGESRTATFALIRYDARGKEIGTAFTHDLTLSQLEILPSRQIRVGRDYAVSFKDVGTTGGDQAKAAGNAAAAKLIDALRKKVGKP